MEKREITLTDKNVKSEIKEVQDKLIAENPEKYTKGSQTGKKKKLVLNANLCISLLWVYKYYRHHELAKKEDYYTKKDFFFDLIGTDNEYIIKNYTQLKHWDLLAPMPTHPTKIIYKRGWWGITEFGNMKFNDKNCAFKETSKPSIAFGKNNPYKAYESLQDQRIKCQPCVKGPSW